ncbi:hypothetical protein BJ508DRAFT_300607 [Ascobolus immersus RN42]|uniref:Uncharacterized protein n=1 Tax=Ascobolus immersus RN42 TaxID=1160509 RepID=A0A3N4J2Z4_ASCIM|nr:hypothetical protein BJ508DRAFT_300607 [Ascobolus immersus RN42]
MYQGNNPTSLPVPNGGFGSRGKNSHIRNINVPVGQQQQQQQNVTTPRTARGHLLAGLRTTRTTPAQTPTAAHPANDGNMGFVESPRYANLPRTATFAPKTARGLGLNTSVGQGSPMSSGNMHLPSPQLPNQPASSPVDYKMQQQQQQQNMMGMMNPAAGYAYLMDLAAQQHRLQAQLLATQQAAQQLEAMQAGGHGNYQNSPSSPYPQQMGGNSLPFFNQAVTGQYQMYMLQQQQQLLQQQQQLQSPIYQQQQHYQQQQYPQHQASVVTQREPSPPFEEQREAMDAASNRANTRSRSPPKVGPIQAPNQSAPAPPAVAGFRRHRKASSLSNSFNAMGLEIDTNGPKTSVPKLSGLPTTPMTATFAPGHASGTHPSRQPRGPPPIEEVKAKPTSKIEGSKNFASRQRRRAVFKLVTAGAERRGATRSGATGGTMTPVSENEATYSFDDGASCSSSLSGKNSHASLRVGNESPKDYSGSSVSGDEGLGGRYVEIKKPSGGLKTPQMILDAAEKRKSAMF